MNLNDPGGQYNPYAAPAPNVGLAPVGSDFGSQVLAERGTRLGAALLDGLLAAVCWAPAVIYGIIQSVEHVSRHRGAMPTDTLYLWTGLGMLLVLPLSIYQWYLITKTGQTLGKKWLKIRIVKLDGSPVDFVTGVVKRVWVMGVIGMVPYLGGCVALVDYLMIFSQERRCLHDQIAGTKVVVAG
jgi:uncharacterized RDD family membrane protein YckC